MAYDEVLAMRVRALLESVEGVSTKAMFGGMAFLVDGHMAVAAAGQERGLMVRIDPADGDGLVDGVLVTRMVMGGRERDGWLLVAGDALDDDATLAGWVDRGVAFVGTLPPKS